MKSCVLCSIINTWTGIGFGALHSVKEDLLLAPELLLDAIKTYPDNIITVSYENILSAEKGEFLKISNGIGIPFSPGITNYNAVGFEKWAFGDPGKVYSMTRPDRENLNRWIDSLQNPKVWRLCKDYLDRLGPDIIGELGYSYEELKRTLLNNKPRFPRLVMTLSLDITLTKPVPTNCWKNLFNHAFAFVKTEGIKGVWVYSYRKCKKLF